MGGPVAIVPFQNEGAGAVYAWICNSSSLKSSIPDGKMRPGRAGMPVGSLARGANGFQRITNDGERVASHLLRKRCSQGGTRGSNGLSAW